MRVIAERPPQEKHPVDASHARRLQGDRVLDLILVTAYTCSLAKLYLGLLGSRSAMRYWYVYLALALLGQFALSQVPISHESGVCLTKLDGECIKVSYARKSP